MYTAPPLFFYLGGEQVKHTAWVVSASQDNALATATKAADGVSRSHYITGVYASYSAAKTGLMQVKVGATIVFEMYVVNHWQ